MGALSLSRAGGILKKNRSQSAHSKLRDQKDRFAKDVDMVVQNCCTSASNPPQVVGFESTVESAQATPALSSPPLLQPRPLSARTPPLEDDVLQNLPSPMRKRSTTSPQKQATKFTDVKALLQPPLPLSPEEVLVENLMSNRRSNRVNPLTKFVPKLLLPSPQGSLYGKRIESTTEDSDEDRTKAERQMKKPFSAISLKEEEEIFVPLKSSAGSLAGLDPHSSAIHSRVENRLRAVKKSAFKTKTRPSTQEDQLISTLDTVIGVGTTASRFSSSSSKNLVATQDEPGSVDRLSQADTTRLHRTNLPVGREGLTKGPVIASMAQIDLGGENFGLNRGDVNDYVSPEGRAGSISSTNLNLKLLTRHPAESSSSSSKSPSSSSAPPAAVVASASRQLLLRSKEAIAECLKRATTTPSSSSSSSSSSKAPVNSNVPLEKDVVRSEASSLFGPRSAAPLSAFSSSLPTLEQPAKNPLMQKSRNPLLSTIPGLSTLEPLDGGSKKLSVVDSNPPSLFLPSSWWEEEEEVPVLPVNPLPADRDAIEDSFLESLCVSRATFDPSRKIYAPSLGLQGIETAGPTKWGATSQGRKPPFQYTSGAFGEQVATRSGRFLGLPTGTSGAGVSATTASTDLFPGAPLSQVLPPASSSTVGDKFEALKNQILGRS